MIMCTHITESENSESEWGNGVWEADLLAGLNCPKQMRLNEYVMIAMEFSMLGVTCLGYISPDYLMKGYAV